MDRPLVARSVKRRLIESYRGPIMRVQLADGRKVDVYDDDPTVEVPPGALRHGQLGAASRGMDVLLLREYDQTGNGHDLVTAPGYEPTLRT